MSKYYKEHYLYNYAPEQINSVGYFDTIDYVFFNVVDIDGEVCIECDEPEKVKEVYKDVCCRLQESGQFIKLDNFLVNIHNVKDIRLKSNKDNLGYGVFVFYKDNSKINIPFDNRWKAREVYSCLIESHNKYVIDCGEQYEDMLNK